MWFIKSDESRGREFKSALAVFLNEFQNLIFFFLNILKLLFHNQRASLSHLVNEFVVLKSELDVRN